MKSRLKLLLVGLVCVLITSYVVAQPHHPGPHKKLPDSAKVQEMFEDFSIQIELDQQQNEIIQKIFQDHFKKAREVLRERKAHQDQYKETMNEMIDEEEVKEMLDEHASNPEINARSKNEFFDKHDGHFDQAGTMIKQEKANHKKNRQKLHELRIDFEAELMSHLSREQLIKFKEFLDNRKPANNMSRPKR